ncbi:MAG: hypothetical protein IPL78_21410 [Chloroflexi bacterium]|nr:hypothetical protein [Chloroflexota bacterium]
MRPGQYTTARGSLDTMILWVAALLLGPIVLWYSFLADWAILLWTLRRETSPSSRWGLFAMQMLNNGPGILMSLVALSLYGRLGGTYPFPGFQGRVMVIAAAAMFLEFVLQLFLSLPFVLSLTQDRTLLAKRWFAHTWLGFYPVHFGGEWAEYVSQSFCHAGSRAVCREWPGIVFVLCRWSLPRQC